MNYREYQFVIRLISRVYSIFFFKPSRLILTHYYCVFGPHSSYRASQTFLRTSLIYIEDEHSLR